MTELPRSSGSTGSKVSVISFASISQNVERLSEGGEGIVFRIRNQPNLVYKEYKANQLPHLNIQALEDLMSIIGTWEASHQARLLSRTVWPQSLVAHGAEKRGFLMPAIEETFYRRYGLRSNPKRVLCDWNHLSYQDAPLPRHMISEVPRPSVEEKIMLIKDLVATVDLLHQHDIIVGDMSGKNLIWTTQPNRVIIIDCDSFRIDGRKGVCVHKESPGWIDPTLQGRQTCKESDIYKLGVAAFRSLWNDPSSVVTPEVVNRSRPSEIPGDLISLIAASVGATNRPSSSDWVRRLDQLFKFNGRPVVAATGTPVTGINRTIRPQINTQPSTTRIVPSSAQTFYLICDESDSMGSHGISAVNEFVKEIHQNLTADPLMLDKSWLSVITFSDEASVVLPLTEFTEVANMPSLALSGKHRRYGPVFELLLKAIERDVAMLNAQGFSVAMRPLVIFISGSTPNDSWQPAYDSLLKHHSRPQILAIGVEAAEPEVMNRITTTKDLIGLHPSRALAEYFWRYQIEVTVSRSEAFVPIEDSNKNSSGSKRPIIQLKNL